MALELFDKWKWLKDTKLIVKVEEDEDGDDGLTFSDAFFNAMEELFFTPEEAIKGNLYPAIIKVAPQAVLLTKTQLTEVEEAIKEMLRGYLTFIKEDTTRPRPGVG